MQQCNLYEAKARLSQLVQAALDGEEVLIARAGKPAVRLVPVSEQNPTTTGWGTLNIDLEALDGAFTPDIEQEVGKLFEGGH